VDLKHIWDIIDPQIGPLVSKSLLPEKFLQKLNRMESYG
jgi:hypothetical protein